MQYKHINLQYQYMHIHLHQAAVLDVHVPPQVGIAIR